MTKRLTIGILFAALCLGLALTGAAPANAHTHHVTTGTGDSVPLANGQKHPGFLLDSATGQYVSCAGVSEPANVGPAGYGLETAHHGPDQGDPGKDDGCFAIDAANGPPSDPRQDRNPAID